MIATASNRRRAHPQSLIFVFLLAMAGLARPAFADPELVGARDFISAISLQDAMLDNDVQLNPRLYHTGRGNQYSLTMVLEKKLAERLCLNITSALESRIEDGQRDTGMENLQMTLFYGFLSLDRYELRATFGVSGYVPTGDPGVRINDRVLLGPTLMFDEGLGWLANRGLIHYLRPFALEGQLEPLFQVGGAAFTTLIAGLDLFYSLNYLDLKEDSVPLTPILNGLSPFVELSHGQAIAGVGDSSPVYEIFPGFAYTWGDERQYQFSVAAPLPLSPSARNEVENGVAMLLTIGLNELLPMTAWTPF